MGRLDVDGGTALQQYADKMPDAPGFTAEMCLIQAILAGHFPGPPKVWARGQLTRVIDNPLFDDILLREAKAHNLAANDANRLRSRLIAEDRLTVGVALSGRPQILRLTDMPDLEPTVAAFGRDLATAKIEADRDPGNPDAVTALAELYYVAEQIRLRQIGFFKQPPPDDIEATYVASRRHQLDDEIDLKARALVLVSLAPRNVYALEFAAVQLNDHFPGTLEALVWKTALATNTIVYTNNPYDMLGSYVSHAKNDNLRLLEQIAAGEAPHYGQNQLDEAIACPYVRALRLLDQSCSDSNFALDQCYTSSGLSHDYEWFGPDSILAGVQARGVCKNELEGTLESLRFSEVKLGL